MSCHTRIRSIRLNPTNPRRPLHVTAECGWTCPHRQGQPWEKSTARRAWLGHVCLNQGRSNP